MLETIPEDNDYSGQQDSARYTRATVVLLCYCQPFPCVLTSEAHL